METGIDWAKVIAYATLSAVVIWVSKIWKDKKSKYDRDGFLK